MIKQQAQTKCAAEITQRLRGTWLHPQQPGILVITPKHNLHTAFGITALQQAQTKAASKRVFMKCNVQLKGEGVQTTTPQAFSFKEGFFFFSRYNTLASFIYLQLRHKASECRCSLTLISHGTLLSCAVLL